jgi:putative SOS response-associated peptidase YedK
MDDSPFAFAFGKVGKIHPRANGYALARLSLVKPNELVAQIHTRMPVILPEEDHAKWLGEVEDGDLMALLKSFPADRMRIWAISPRVNSPENNGQGIIVPIPGDVSDWKPAGS